MPFLALSLLFCSLERIKVQKVLKVKRLFVSLSHIYDWPESDYIHYTIQYIGSRILYIKKKPSWTMAALEAGRLPVIIPRSHPIKCCCHSCRCHRSTAVTVCCHCCLLHWQCIMVMWHRWAQWGECNGAKYEGVGTTISSLQASS